MAFETLAAISSRKQGATYPTARLSADWKKLMLLQNHDFSVARSYRAFTEDGMVSEAGSLGIVEYEKLTRACDRETSQLLSHWKDGDAQAPAEVITLFNSIEVPHRRTVELELDSAEDAEIALFQGDGRIPFQVTGSDGGKVFGLAVVDLPALGTATVTRGDKQSDKIAGRALSEPRHGESWIEDENIRIEWVPNTWTVSITDKKSGSKVDFSGFSGPIGKMNEHDANKFHALSPGHEVFTFAFDGTTHAPDQNARVTAKVEKTGTVCSTLLLRCDLLTLHSTPTPVAFAEARVSLYHPTGKVECQSHYYTGVYLSLQCWASFKHNIRDARYHRDFPFGEEEAQVEYVYPNSYTRVSNKTSGFTLLHPGVQRARILRGQDGGEVKHLLARDRTYGDYTWTFSLVFGDHQSWESAALAKAEHAHIAIKAGKNSCIPSYVQFSDSCILMSALYKEADGRTMLRLVNYSGETICGAKVTLDDIFEGAELTDFTGAASRKAELAVDQMKSVISLDFKPWEIVTLALF